MKKQTPAWGRGCGVDSNRNRFGTTIIPLLRPRPNRPGILNYRQQRSVADFSRAIRQALEREATLREQAGEPDEWLRDCAEWIERGCLP